MTALYEHDHDDVYRATGLTRGPWHPDHQHGGPPAALVTGTLLRWGDAPETFQLARITVALLRPVPIGRVTVRVEPERLGRQVRRLTGWLDADDGPVLRVDAILVRRVDLPITVAPHVSDWPEPDTLDPFRFTFFPWDEGYHRAVDLRLALGRWGTTPVGFWTRPAVPLVAGRPWLPEERVIVVADAQSGMGPPLDPTRWSFVNPDLTVHLGRVPVGDWVGFEVRSQAGPQGVGLAQSALRDVDGELGRSAQSLVVAPRA